MFWDLHEISKGTRLSLRSVPENQCIPHEPGQVITTLFEVHVLVRAIQSFMMACMFYLAGAEMPAFSADTTEPVLISENEKDAYAGISVIKLTLTDMELGQAVQFIASLSKTKIEVHQNFVHSKVSCDYKGVTFAEVMANLARQVRGEVFWKDGKPKEFYIKPQPLNSSKPK